MSRHRQKYRLMQIHKRFIAGVVALTWEQPAAASATCAQIADRAHLNRHSARRLTEGLTHHGYIERVHRGSASSRPEYRLTAKGWDLVKDGPAWLGLIDEVAP